jgi:Asp-tRNA(Asn)/Glu-tRNA(Gln) amidotransferase A subunit family amidase
MARTVADAVAVFQAIAGEDPTDAVTARSRGRVHANYASFLDRDGLRGARIGVLREAYQRPTTDPEVERVFRTALDDMRRAGATIIDSASIDGFDELMRNRRGGCSQFKFDLNAYLAGLGDQVPVHSLEEIIESRDFHPTIRDRLQGGQEADVAPEDNPACERLEGFREDLRAAVLATMERHQLDAFVYPTWSNPPRLIGDLNTPHGDNSQVFSPSTGFPAIQVPMGYVRGGILPAGMSLFGRPWREDVLIRLAFAYEQATRHRRPPTTTPPLNHH